jgi:hypothetical protein
MNKEHLSDGAYAAYDHNGFCVSAPRAGRDDEVYLDYSGTLALLDYMHRAIGSRAMSMMLPDGLRAYIADAVKDPLHKP